MYETFYGAVQYWTHFVLDVIYDFHVTFLVVLFEWSPKSL